MQKAKRTELLVRIFYGIILYIVFIFWAIVAYLADLLLSLYILVLGRRHKGLSDFLIGFQRYAARMHCYLMGLTDERAPMSGR